MARSITDVTFSPICIAWTEKLTKGNKCPIKVYVKPTPSLRMTKQETSCKKMTVLVVHATDDRKMVFHLLFNVNLVKGVENFFDLWNSCVFKHVIKFIEPTLKFLGTEFEVWKMWGKNYGQKRKSSDGSNTKKRMKIKLFTLVSFSFKPYENKIDWHGKIDRIDFHKL